MASPPYFTMIYANKPLHAHACVPAHISVCGFRIRLPKLRNFMFTESFFDLGIFCIRNGSTTDSRGSGGASTATLNSPAVCGEQPNSTSFFAIASKFFSAMDRIWSKRTVYNPRAHRSAHSVVASTHNNSKLVITATYHCDITFELQRRDVREDVATVRGKALVDILRWRRGKIDEESLDRGRVALDKGIQNPNTDTKCTTRAHTQNPCLDQQNPQQPTNCFNKHIPRVRT